MLFEMQRCWPFTEHCQMLNRTALPHTLRLANQCTRIGTSLYHYSPGQHTPDVARWRASAHSPVKQRNKVLQQINLQRDRTDFTVDDAESLSQRIGSNSATSTSEWLCDALLELVQPDSQFFDWKWGAKVHYRQRGQKGPCVLLIHGFGVGSFSWAEVMPLLASDHRVWALDLLGQGLSWPCRDQIPGGELRLSIDTWTELLTDFITNVIKAPCYVVGNSLGGYLSAQLAATQRHLCRGVVYLNATPFWAFMPRPDTQDGIGRLFRRIVRYDGVMPAPERLKSVIRRLWWDKFTTEETIRGVLEQVYHYRSAADAELLSNILAAASHELAVDAIASIIFSPGTAQPFGQLAAAAQCPSCLIYGREDPWVRPIWGQRLKRLVPHAAYFEISPAGHCPHDEAPEAVHWCLGDWIASVEQGTPLSLDIGEKTMVQCQDGREISVRHVSGNGQTLVERVVESWHRFTDRLGAGRSRRVMQ